MLNKDDTPAFRGRFTHRNETFTCEACARIVPPAPSGCRNHCPYCLTSKHVDVFPGDRENPCGSLMDAVGYELNAKKGLVLTFRCRRCAALTRNRASREGEAPDDYDKILALSRRN